MEKIFEINKVKYLKLKEHKGHNLTVNHNKTRGSANVYCKNCNSVVMSIYES